LCGASDIEPHFIPVGFSDAAFIGLLGDIWIWGLGVGVEQMGGGIDGR